MSANQPVSSLMGSSEVEDLRAEVAQLRAALETRDAIGQAKGIVRLLTGCDSHVAFQILGSLSQETNRKLKDVAVVVADCASSGRALPRDLAASWSRNTEQVSAEGEAISG